MALKFLNKKGWHTGSLRNVENVWKAEQKHEAEQKKLEELRKQIHEERERAEFRELQEQAGLVPRQERLDFLYESGLAVGKGSSGFKELESLPKNDAGTSASSSATAKPDAPGALFEDKPHSANDAWRKLNSDPLLMIRQREQEALARIKNNPVKMAMIRKSVEVTKGKDKEEKKSKKKKHEKSSKRRKHISSEDDSEDTNEKHITHQWKHQKMSDNLDRESSERGHRHKASKDHRHNSPSIHKHDRSDSHPSKVKRSYHDSHRENHSSKHKDESHPRDKQNHSTSSSHKPRDEFNDRHQRKPVQLSEEERAAKLREMQMNAELHEEQRWKRLKKAEAKDAEEAIRDRSSLGRNFLDATQRSVYGAEKGGSSTIEESVRRRSHYLQGRSATETNAFRR